MHAFLNEKLEDYLNSLPPMKRDDTIESNPDDEKYELTEKLAQINNEIAAITSQCTEARKINFTLKKTLSKVTEAIERNLESYNTLNSELHEENESMQVQVNEYHHDIQRTRDLFLLLTQSGIDLRQFEGTDVDWIMKTCNIQEDELQFEPIDPEVSAIVKSHKYFNGCCTNNEFARKTNALQDEIINLREQISQICASKFSSPAKIRNSNYRRQLGFLRKQLIVSKSPTKTIPTDLPRQMTPVSQRPSKTISSSQYHTPPSRYKSSMQNYGSSADKKEHLVSSPYISIFSRTRPASLSESGSPARNHLDFLNSPSDSM